MVCRAAAGGHELLCRRTSICMQPEQKSRLACWQRLRAAVKQYKKYYH